MIMRHIRESLAEPSAIRWRRTHAALVLVEGLLSDGAQELFDETAEGRHFDLVQQLSLLERFDCTTDKRVQNMVRSKASGMRAEVVSRLQSAGDSSSVPEANCDRNSDPEANCDRASTCSAGSAHSTCSPAASGSAGSDTSSLESSPAVPGSIGSDTLESGDVPWRPEGRMVLNGIVAVGHTDDTTSESSSDENTKRKAVAFRPVRKTKGVRQSQAKGPRSQDRSDSESSGSDIGRREAPQAAVPQASAPAVDLLGL